MRKSSGFSSIESSLYESSKSSDENVSASALTGQTEDTAIIMANVIAVKHLFLFIDHLSYSF